MRPEKQGQELRLAAVPLCAGIVFAVTRGMTEVWNGENLMPGFLYGSFIGVVLGIPLLLRSDAKGADTFKRHLLNALIQALAAWVLSGASIDSLALAASRGVMLGLFFSGTNYCIGQLNKLGKERRPAQHGRLYAVPLSGSLTLATATTVAFSGPDAGVSIFFVSALIGGFLSMLVGWPVLWFIERYLQTPLRYIAGGMITGLLIWTLTSLPNLFQALNAFLSPSISSQSIYAWPKYFLGGMALFVFLGMVAGFVCTIMVWGFERAKRVNAK